MVRITEDLIRKRAEHNNLEISTLEEVSLHQQDIERIEHLDKWCRDLKILYLQSNLIPKIENVNRLKKLEYLNLALNNIEKIENVQGCEFLNKLDLTVNFIGELTSIESLKENYNLRELFLTGNPCTQFEGYKEYVLATLPQLKWLDGKEIEKSERIKAQQSYEKVSKLIDDQEKEYKVKRERQKKEAAEKEEREREKEAKKNKPGFDRRWYTDMNKEGEPQKDKQEEEKDENDFWNEKVDFTPESRLEVHKQMQKTKEKQNKSEPTPQKPVRRLFNDEGRALNVNEPKIDFTLTEDDHKNIILDMAVYKHMDTSLLDCDVQPTYVRVTVKGKIFQLCLPEDVLADSSSAKRSQITGHLVVTMPKAKASVVSILPKTPIDPSFQPKPPRSKSTREVLEVDSKSFKGVDIANIVKEKKNVVPPLGSRRIEPVTQRENSDDFVDDPDVPPLM